MKNVLATIIGLIIAGLTVHLFEAVIGHNLFTFPADAQLSDMEWIKNNMDKIPTGSKIIVVIAHFAGIIVGMFTAAKISKQSIIPSHIVGGLMLIATFVTIFMLPKELWFSISDGIFAIAGFLIGKIIAQKQITNF
ncbi:hypothetical protein HNV10_12985 [Winogradskyella litoriviva]|uniref:Uncharacterized protein n=1 Tax=Winogradskyella litoriviva TaxID=1220182 RepID=A0ABX2E6U9_9FLAO|nr:hypothetical protein [Winogradskyella litoriviva]NRD24168.1 hypothetical protein [Winogradskyella litoriviva]